MQIDLWKNHGSISLDKALNLWVSVAASVTELPGVLNETMHVKHSESNLHRQMLNLLAVVSDPVLLCLWFFTAHTSPVFTPSGWWILLQQALPGWNTKQVSGLAWRYVLCGPWAGHSSISQRWVSEHPHPLLAGHSPARLVAAGILVACWLATCSTLLFLRWEGPPEGIWDITLCTDLCRSPAFLGSGMLISSFCFCSFPCFRTK